MIHAEIFCRENFEKISKILKSGEICVLPTDTILGFSSIPSVSFKIATIKNRPPEKPFLLLFPDFFSAEKAVVFSPLARFLFSHFSDPITLVLPRKKGIFPDFFPTESFLALRVPRSDLLLRFLHFLGEPLCSTSINISGENPIITPSEIALLFPEIPLFYNPRDIPKSPSGIVQIEGDSLKILRGDDMFCHTIKKMQLNFFERQKSQNSLLEKGEFWER